ncbi:MAG TPA: 3-oxoacyl-[acyl-carrier-protein] synthase III C-terminal domain-containing protein [Pseudoneobacillus sp.]|nr:3-oxoacyl-[acyl-carrier-protein] synthase III C-terminal domain-containing protein [Pseudoneobacillus sp.]
MPKIISIAEAIPPFVISQHETMKFARELFSESFKDIERLLTAFQNGQIEKRHFAKGLDWFKKDHSFQEKNDTYIEEAVSLGKKAIENCLHSNDFLKKAVDYQDIDAIFTISSTGIATPSIEARIMNHLPFSPHTKRIPIWGLGCAGGASGLSRAFEYCLAFPKAKVLVLTIELCSLTFQKNDRSKSNLIGTSLFADGVACALIVGDEVQINHLSTRKSVPSILGTQSTTKKDSIDVMGWDLKDEGLFVIFSKSIPVLIENWLKPNVETFLSKYGLTSNDIKHFIAHPGGLKVLEAYVKALQLPMSMIDYSLQVLQSFGNMSSSTVFYVLDRFMKDDIPNGDVGIIAALGPGFSSELLLVRWE